MHYYGSGSAPAERVPGLDAEPLRCAASARSGPGPDRQPWTATRCHGLLRQLQSRLAVLRRLPASDEQRAVIREPKRRCLAQGSTTAPAKRVRFTYGGRKRHGAAEGREAQAQSSLELRTPPRPVRARGAMSLIKSSPVAGQMDIPTPVWRRIRQPEDTPLRLTADRAQSPAATAPASTVPEAAGDLPPLRAVVGDHRYRIYQAILTWLNILLLSTMPDAGEPRRNSLLGMCLHKIPACIANIEAYERSVAKDEGRQSMWDASNVSFELYGQLEALGSSSCGWRPLKLATRSHAMSLLCEAASEGLFDPAYVTLLVRLCLRLHCTEEAGRLASSVGVALPPPRTMRSSLLENRRLLPLHEVLDFSKSKAASGPALRCVSALIKDRLLPVEWLSSRAFADMWARALEAMASRRSGAAVMDFTMACLPLLATQGNTLADVQKDDAEHRLAGPVAGMVAATLTISAMGHDVDRGPRRRRAWRRVLHVLDHCLYHVCRRRRRRTRYHDGEFMLSLARHVALAGSPFANAAFAQQAREELVALAARASDAGNAQSHYRQAMLLLCSLAQHRSRSCAMPGRDSVSDLCSKLDILELGACYGHSLQKDVAFLLAQRTKDLRDLAFAESLPGATESPWATTMFSGWRWEEGISEWVLPGEGFGGGRPVQEMRKLPRQLRNHCRSSSLGPALPAMATAAAKTTRGSFCSTGHENRRQRSPPEALSQGGQPKPLARRVRARPVPSGLLRLLPSEDDWDDLG